MAVADDLETLAGVVLANQMPPRGLTEVVRRIAPRPVLLITGTEGNDDEELNAVYQRAGGPSFARWDIPDAGHTGGLAIAPREYEQRVASFFGAALLDD